MKNHYHPEEIEELAMVPAHKWEIIKKGRERPLKETEIDTLRYTSSYLDSSTHYARAVYCRYVSWCILDEELICGLRLFLARNKIKRIIEPFAGRGLLRKFTMNPTITSWHAYDRSPPKDSGVIRVNVQQVLKSILPGEMDAIVVSWVPYNGKEDLALLRASKKHQLPILWIGESWGGCTGSERFWDALDKQGFDTDYHEHGVDVQRWYGINDQFMVIRPPPPRAPHRERKVHNLRPRRAKVRRA